MSCLVQRRTRQAHRRDADISDVSESGPDLVARQARGDNLPVAVRQTFQPATPQCAAQVHDHIDTGRWSPTMDREAAVIARNRDGPIDGEIDEEFDRHPSSATVKPSGWVGDA